MFTANDIFQKAQSLSRWNAQKLYYHFNRKTQRNLPIKRGEVYFVDLGQNIGSEENKIRPVVVIQSNTYNQTSPVFIGAIVSSSPVTIQDVQIPISGSYPYIDKNGNSQLLKGAIDLGQIRTLAKERIISRICALGSEMDEVDEKLPNIIGLKPSITAMANIINSLKGKVDYLKAKLEKLQE